MPEWLGRWLVPGLFALIFIILPALAIGLSIGGGEVIVQPQAESALPRD